MAYVEVARSETERGELVLRAHERTDPVDPAGPAGPSEPVLELRAGGLFVMDTAETTTERALATAALAEHPDPSQVLVGGLGLGFTAREVLADPRVQRCTVVEVEPDLVDWLRTGLVPHGPPLLAEPRLSVVVADVAEVLADAAPASYDVVLLDVDNGPHHLVHAANAALYEQPLLAAVRRALRPGGVLAIWSADEAPELQAAITDAYGASEARPLAVRLQRREEHYWLLLGRAPG